MKNLDYYADERERLWDASSDPQRLEIECLKEEIKDLKRDLQDMKGALETVLDWVETNESEDRIREYIWEVLEW